MKHHNMVRILTTTILLSLFASCNFETDGKFNSLVAGFENERQQPLRPPSNVAATGDTSGGIQISWNISDGADGYTVYRASADNPTRFVRRGSSGGTAYVDSGASVPPDTPFYYQVTAYNSGEVSGPSTRAGPATAARNQAVLEAPEISGADVLNNSITIAWTPVAGADGYILYRASMYDGDVYIFRITTNMPSFTDNNLAAGSYLYQVRGYSGHSEGYVSAPSDPVSIGAGPVLPVPAKPQNLRAVADYSGLQPVIAVSWNAAANATLYHVYRSVDDEFYEKIDEVSSTTYQDDGVTSGAAYYYRVRGYNGTQEGYLSDSYGPVLLVPAKPQIAASVANNAVTVSWSAVRGADIYYVSRSTDDSQFQLVTARGTGNTEHTDLGLAAGTYYYRVEAANSAGRGLPSDSAQAVINPAAPVISTHPVGGNYLRNVPANPLIVQASASGGGTLSYQWYSNSVNSNTGGTLVSGAVSASYTPPTATAGTVYYYVLVTDIGTAATVASNVAAVTVMEGVTVHAATPVISEHPSSGVYSQGDTATALTVQANVSDGGALSYQWYSNTVNSNTGGTLVSSASTYTPSTSTAGTLYYYVIVTNTNNGVNGNKTATAVSNTAAVTVTGEASYAIPDGGAIIYISTQAALESIRDHIDDSAYNYGKNAYVLEQDITLTGTWTPIGRVNSAFSGNFYGSGHTIRNLVLPGGSLQYIGLFGYIDGTLIQDLQVELGETTISISSNGSKYIGIIAGAHKDSVIRNCGVYSLSEIIINDTSGGWNFLNISGISSRDENSSSIIEHCYVVMNIRATFGGDHLLVGGITVSTGIIKNCYYIGNITGNGVYLDLNGVARYYNTLEKSYSAGTMTNNASYSNYTTTSGIGLSDGTISNCATLMEQIYQAIGTGYARISPSTSSTLTNNYAYSGMLLNGATVTSNDPNSQNGLDKTAAQLKQRSTYESGLGWDFTNVWEMGPSSYPFPILKWQNGVVKLPQGFNVIGSGETINVASPAEFASALSAIQNSSNDDFTITATADMSLSPQNLIGTAYRNKKITLRGNTALRKITLSSQGSLFTVGADMELVLEDIVLAGISNNNTSLVKVNTGGKLVLNGGGKVTGNTYSTSVADSGGAGVYVDGGTLEIAGGEVSGNTVNGTIRGEVRGGGVYALNDSNVLMTSGAVKDNIVTNVASGEIIGADGGGIFIHNGSSFEMTGGFIEGNTVNSRSTNLMAGASGGAVYVATNSSFYFKGGTIRNNTVNSDGNGYCLAYGGGVISGDSSTMIMSGGIISGNNVTSSAANSTYGSNWIYEIGAYGGGVGFSLPNITFVKTGGIIYGSEVSGNDTDGIPLKNTAQIRSSNGLGGGHAIYAGCSNGTGDSSPRRNTTVGETDDLYTSGSNLVDGRQ